MSGVENIRVISTKDLAVMGVHDVAYVKSIKVDSGTAYAVHGADGARMAVFTDRDVAFAAITQNDLEAVSVH